jgi:hypothetical protein
MYIKRTFTKEDLLNQLKKSKLNQLYLYCKKYDVMYLDSDKKRKYRNEFKELINNITEYKTIKDELNHGCFSIKSNEKWYKVDYRITFYDNYLLNGKIEIYCFFNFKIHKEIIDEIENGLIKEIIYISGKY